MQKLSSPFCNFFLTFSKKNLDILKKKIGKAKKKAKSVPILGYSGPVFPLSSAQR
jgi:hypothetical protein